MVISMSLARLFIRKVRGKKNIPLNMPLVVVANHDSYLDPFLIVSILDSVVKKKIHFLVMKGRFWNKFGDRLSRGCGCIPLDDGKEKALKEMEYLLKKKEIVALFPGGPRSLDGSLPKGKTGAVRLALSTKAQILPIGIIGSYEIAPQDKLIPKLRRCEVNIGRPISLAPAKKITKRSLNLLTDKVMVEIAKLSNKKYKKCPEKSKSYKNSKNF